MKFILLTLLLYYIRLMSFEVAGDDRVRNCCLEVKNTRISVENISDYYIQYQPFCPINAIRFRTRRNKTICLHPKDIWANTAMKKIDERKKVKSSRVCNTSISIQIPTTTIKTSGPETETSSVTSFSTVASTVTIFKTPSLQTEIKTTATKQATVSTKSSQSPLTSTNPCATQPPTTATSTTTTATSTPTTAVPNTMSTKNSTTKKIPKSIQRKLGKSKKGLRKYQMRIGKKDKSTGE